MPTKAYGRMVFWEGASLWVLGTRPGEGPYPKTKFHAHHAVQVTLSLRGWFTLETRDRQLGGNAAAVAPDTEHAPAPRVAGLPARLRAGFESPHRSDQSLIDLGRATLAKLAPGSERDERPEARVRRMSAWATGRLDTPVSLANAAAHVGLSTGRARHLFVEETGLPFRTYLLWRRLMRAAELFSAGSSLTDAAHGAGFSDSSHLSRTFRRMFGIAADSLRLM